MNRLTTILTVILILVGCADTVEDYVVISLQGAPVIYVKVGGVYIEPGYIANSSIDGDISSRVCVDRTGIDLSTPGSYSIAYSVASRNGGTAEAFRVVNVVSDTGTLSMKGESVVRIRLLETFDDPGIEAVDTDGSDCLSSVKVESNFKNDVPGNYTIKYSFTDSLGILHTAVRTVQVVIPEEPVIILDGDGRSEQNPLRVGQAKSENQYLSGIMMVEPGWRAYCREYGDVSSYVSPDYSGVKYDAVNFNPQAVSYTLTVGETTVSTTRYIIIVDDAVPPVITLTKEPYETFPADKTKEFGDTSGLLYDFNAEDETSEVRKFVSVYKIDSTSNPTFEKIVSDEDLKNILKDIGLYKIVYTATDDSGNSSTAHRFIEVYDVTPPVLTVTVPRKSESDPEEGETDKKTETVWEDVVLTSDLTEVQELPYDSPKNLIISNVIAVDESAAQDVLIIQKTEIEQINTRIPGTYETVYYGEDTAGNRSYRFTRIVRILPPPEPVVQNYSFEDYAPAIGELDKDTNQIVGWQFENVRAFKVAGTYSQWGEVYNGVGPFAYSERFASANFAEASSKGSVGYSSAFLCGVIRTAEEEYIPNTSIPISMAHYYTRTVGAIMQKKIFVYADVTYKLNVDFMYQIHASSQDVEFFVSRSDFSPSLRLTGKTYKADGSVQNVNNGTQVSRYVSTRSMNREGTWNLIELEFTPTQDGYIDLRFGKTDIGNGADRNGTGTWIDNVRIIPVKY
ncbi:MAG: DUF5011 domain-containing protein [Spirochaetia bacterium]|nr:DUF5011 domain-containing protein [Spirochaetia bacterium]